MDVKALDKALLEIINSRQELSKIDYSNPTYDDLEEKLHDLEDAFIDTFGADLEAALQKVHDEHCPDSEVLMPIAYIAKKYNVDSRNEYSVPAGEGVYVEVDKFPGKDTKLALLPAPPRIILNVGDQQQVVWTAK